MSRGLIIDIIFNREVEWDARDIQSVAKNDFGLTVTIEEVLEVVRELTEKGLIEDIEDEDELSDFMDTVTFDRCDKTIDLFGVAA
jgi:hypothetical protein